MPLQPPPYRGSVVLRTALGSTVLATAGEALQAVERYVRDTGRMIDFRLFLPRGTPAQGRQRLLAAGLARRISSEPKLRLTLCENLPADQLRPFEVGEQGWLKAEAPAGREGSHA